MVGLGAVPAVLQAALLLLLMPETPRWLVRAGRPAAARRVIWSTVAGEAGEEKRRRQREDGGGEDDPVSTRLVDRILKDIETEVREEEEERRRAVAVAASGRKDGGGGGGEWVQGWRELLSVPRNRRALTIACLLQSLQQLCGFVRFPFTFHSSIHPVYTLSHTHTHGTSEQHKTRLTGLPNNRTP